MRAGVPEAGASKLASMFRKSYDGAMEDVAGAWAELRPTPESVELDEYGYEV